MDNLNFNWNYMCADCHSTNLRKGNEAARADWRRSR